MNQAAKILLPLLLLGGVAGAAYYLLNREQPAPPGATAPATPPQSTSRPPQEPVPVVATPAPTPTTQDPKDRVAVTVPGENRADAPQGVRGRVLLPTGAAAVDVPVYLMQSMTSNALELYLAARTGQRFPPVASERTHEDGSFALGVTTPGQTFDLRVASDDYPELQYRSIKVRDGDWYDAGDLRLEVGIVVQGRVTAEGQGFPIASARVYLTTPNQSVQMLPTPGRERGLTVATDNAGCYRFANAPRDSAVTIGADAPEFAYAEHANLQLKPAEPNECNLELAHGMPISGLVVDAAGKAVAAATINATALSAKLPQVANTRSDGDGAFTLPTLREGPYQLVASANGYEEATQKPVMAGQNDVKIVLEQRGRVRLRVLSARGVPLRNYDLSLRRYFANNPGAIGKVMEFRDNQRITPGDYDGDYANIRNVPIGEFVFQITEKEHAKTLSPPFQVAPGQPPPQVEVTLTMGAAITGIVVDDRGQPVPGAVVATDMSGGLAIEGSFGEIFKQLLPDKHTLASIRTDGGGRFRIGRLAFADYMLRVSHPDFCEGVALDIKLEVAGELKDVGMIALARGAVVEGTCTVGGQPAGQIKVVLGPPETANPGTDPQGRPKVFFTASAITDNDGHYRLLKRAPPGTYKIHAAREAGSNNIFEQFWDIKSTQRPLVIGAGQEQSVQDFDLPRR